jgi:hypothetical protein
MNYYFKSYKFAIATLLIVLAPLLMAQASDNRVAVPIDLTRPVNLRAHLVSGSITVKGGDVKEVTVEAKPEAAKSPTAAVAGLRA